MQAGIDGLQDSRLHNPAWEVACLHALCVLCYGMHLEQYRMRLAVFIYTHTHIYGRKVLMHTCLRCYPTRCYSKTCII